MAVSRVRVSGVLIDQWCATTTASLADARNHTRVCALMDGCVGSGFVIFTDTKLVRIPNEHKDLVIEFLESSPKQNDLRVTAEFLEDGDRFALVRLTHEE